MDENTAGAIGAVAVILVYLLIFLSPLIILLVGGLVGAYLERQHFADIARREQSFQGFSVTDLGSPPDGMVVGQSTLVDGSVVIAADHFKTLRTRFRKLIGGEFSGLRKMQELARREAILRMMESARAQGATAVCNVRVVTSTIAGKRPDSVGGCEVIASGTALIPATPVPTPPELPTRG